MNGISEEGLYKLYPSEHPAFTLIVDKEKETVFVSRFFLTIFRG